MSKTGISKPPRRKSAADTIPTRAEKPNNLERPSPAALTADTIQMTVRMSKEKRKEVRQAAAEMDMRINEYFLWLHDLHEKRDKKATS